MQQPARNHIYPPDWTGSETVTFTATDPTLLSSSDSVTFVVAAPTNVTVSSFTGSSHLSTAQLDWETASEIGLLGFNLYRSETLDGAKTTERQPHLGGALG